MGIPRRLPPPDGPGREPVISYGAFLFTWVFSGVLVLVGLAMALLASGAVGDVGFTLVALGVLGLLSGAGGFFGERWAARRRGPPPGPPEHNGRGVGQAGR